MSDIYTGLLTLLDDDSPEPSAWSTVGGRVYADQLPNDVQLPAIRLAILDDRPEQRLAGNSNATVSLQVDVYADRSGSAAAWSVDALVRRAMNRKRVAVQGFARVEINCIARGRPLKEGSYYRVTSTYRLYGSAL